LKAEFDVARQFFTMSMQHFSDGQPDGRMTIMPAGMHDPGIL
jgi:hypothetical protein